MPLHTMIADVAWGNVKNITDNTTGEVTFKCQHGPGEGHSGAIMALLNDSAMQC